MKYLMCLILNLTIISSCQLSEPKPESEKFYCKINGDKFCPFKSSSSATLGSNSLQLIWDEKDGSLYFRARNNPKSLRLIIFFKGKNVTVGKISLGNNVLDSKG
jgi:hypothetical protein